MRPLRQQPQVREGGKKMMKKEGEERGLLTGRQVLVLVLVLVLFGMVLADRPQLYQ